MRDVIVCFVGKSGTGKTSIAFKLRHKYNIIQSYTTRPERKEHEWGHLYVNPDDAIPYYKIIAYTSYNGYKYWATKDQYQNKGISIYVVDPRGVKYLKDKVKDAKIVTIYLECSLLVRFSRLVKRDGIFKAVSRLFTDRKDFKDAIFDYRVNTKGEIKYSVNKVRATIIHAVNWRGIQ